MNYRSIHRYPTWTGTPCYGPSLLAACLFFLMLTAPLFARPVQGSVFEVNGIEIEIPLPISGNRSPRNIGLDQAQDMAFTRLFNSTLTRSNQDFNQDFLQTLRREKNLYIERSVVRSERRRLNVFQMEVDVTFSRKAISEAYARAGIAHTQSAYPSTLLTVKANTQGGQKDFRLNLEQAAKQYGINLERPLGDMEDMVNLSWEQVADSNPTVHEWIQSRYKTQQVWAVRINLAIQVGSSSQLQSYIANAQLIESNKQGTSKPVLARAEGGYYSVQQAQDTLFPAIAQVLLSQVADRWISQNSVEPTLRHEISIRIIHNFNHLRYKQFIDSLPTVPGFSGFRYDSLTAREVVIKVEYQGLDNTLLTALSQLGVQVQSNPDGGMLIYLL